MKRNRLFTWLLLIALLMPILVACGGGGGGATEGGAGAQATTGTGGGETAATTDTGGGGAATEATTGTDGGETAATTGADTGTTAETATAAGDTGTMAETATAGGDTGTTAGTTATAAGAATGATAGATTTGGAAAGSAALGDMPANLRTDLRGQSIKFLGGAAGPATTNDKQLITKFVEATGIDVQFIEGPQSATERLAQYLQQLGAQSGDVDVYQIDVIWPGILAQHAHDLNPAVQQWGVEYFDRIVKNNTVEGKLVGVPWFTDAGLLYYRTDLLQKYGYQNPPTTWKELEDMAKKIQDGERQAGNNDFWGFVWQGAAYEGLTCDALEWQVSQGGGNIVEPDGTISINNPQAAAAFDRAKTWIGNISPPGVTGYKEEEARGVWQGGNAAFMRNWPYAYSIGQAGEEGQASPIKDKFQVSVLPKGDGQGAQNAATLGGWQLMVSNYSQKKDAATEFVRWFTSPETQKQRALLNSNLPTIASVYEDADVLKAYPFFEDLLPVFTGGAVPRPSTVTADLYNDVSTAYFTKVNQVLTGQIDGKTAVEQLQEEITEILE